MSNLYRVGVKADKKNSLPEKVIIPTRQGKVIAIADRGFEGCTTIKEIVLPENTQFMGANAFFGCDNLDTISINKTLAEVNELNWPDGWNVSATVNYKPAVKYSVFVNSFNGSVSGLNADRKYEANAVVSFIVSVNSGYELVSVAYNGTTLTANAGTYSFTMPAKEVMISINVKQTTQPEEPDTPVEPDVPEEINITATRKYGSSLDKEETGVISYSEEYSGYIVRFSKKSANNIIEIIANQPIENIKYYSALSAEKWVDEPGENSWVIENTEARLTVAKTISGTVEFLVRFK